MGIKPSYERSKKNLKLDKQTGFYWYIHNYTKNGKILFRVKVVSNMEDLNYFSYLVSWLGDYPNMINENNTYAKQVKLSREDVLSPEILIDASSAWVRFHVLT